MPETIASQQQSAKHLAAGGRCAGRGRSLDSIALSAHLIALSVGSLCTSSFHNKVLGDIR